MAEPADLAGDFLQGVKTGAQIRSEQQRLQQEQQQEAQKLQMASQQQSARLAQVKQQAQQEHDLQQQRIQVSAAYQKQTLALRKRQLDQVAAVNAEKTQAAARQYQARQMWQSEFGKIDADKTLSDEQKDAAKRSTIMKLAPMMGIPGSEAASMTTALRPPKPIVPASVEDKGDFMQVTQPNGMVQLHPKPRAGAEHDPSVKVALDDSGSLVSMPKSQAMQVIPSLPENLQTNAVNKAVLTEAQPSGSAQRAAPKAGEVYKGHRFLGGNPSQKENWEKVDE